MNIFSKVNLLAWHAGQQVKASLTIDIRDVFVFGGLAIMSYGLYLFKPWVAYTVSGMILMALGLFLARHK